MLCSALRASTSTSTSTTSVGWWRATTTRASSSSLLLSSPSPSPSPSPPPSLSPSSVVVASMPRRAFAKKVLAKQGTSAGRATKQRVYMSSLGDAVFQWYPPASFPSLPTSRAALGHWWQAAKYLAAAAAEYGKLRFWVAKGTAPADDTTLTLGGMRAMALEHYRRVNAAIAAGDESTVRRLCTERCAAATTLPSTASAHGARAARARRLDWQLVSHRRPRVRGLVLLPLGDPPQQTHWLQLNVYFDSEQRVDVYSTGDAGGGGGGGGGGGVLLERGATTRVREYWVFERRMGDKNATWRVAKKVQPQRE